MSLSRTQAVVALSSAEAELYAMAAVVMEMLGAQACLRELGFEVRAVLRSDASAALDAVRKRGPGRLKHVSVKWWFLQDLIAERRIFVEKVPGEENPADLLTKAVSLATLARLLPLVGLRPGRGREEVIGPRSREGSGRKTSSQTTAVHAIVMGALFPAGAVNTTTTTIDLDTNEVD